MAKELTEEDFEDTPKEPKGNEQLTEEDVVELGDLGVSPKPPEGEGEEEKPKLTPEGPPKLKYKSHEEAEKAYAEAERLMHEATSKASGLEKERDQLLQEKERYQTALKNLEKPAPPQKEEAKLIRQAREAIGKLDEKDPDYDAKVDTIWAEAHAKISDLRWEQREAERGKFQDNVRYAEGRAKEEGLSLVIDDPDFGKDYDIGLEAFWLVARSPVMPKEVMGNREKETEWIIGRLKAYNEAIIEAHEAKKRGEQRGPGGYLGRGGKVPAPKEEDNKPSTLIEDGREVLEERKLK
jgi:hypothetical protein